jgi:hypothetical protein
MSFPIYPVTMTFDEDDTDVLIGVLLNINALVSPNDIDAFIGCTPEEIRALWMKVRGFRDAEELRWMTGTQ